MSRTSTLPTAYATIGELERGFLHQMRRFHRSCAELGASRPIILSAPGFHVERDRSASDTPLNSSEHQQLELLRSQGILLQNMSGQILANFSGDPRAEVIRKKIDELLQVVETKSGQLREQLGKVARKQVDRSVVVRNHQLMQLLQTQLAKSIGGITEMYLQGDVQLPSMRGEPVRADVAYLRIKELRGPDGFVHPSYYVMTCHPTGPGNGRLMQMYVASGPNYLLPGRIKWNSTAKNPRELQQVVTNMLVGEGVIGKSFDRDLPIPAARVQFSHDNVKKTTVNGSQIRVLVRDKAQIEETRAQLRRQLTSIVRQVDPRNRDVIRDRVEPSKGLITMTFSLPGALRGRVVEPDVLKKLGDMFDLDAATLQRVRTAIENPE